MTRPVRARPNTGPRGSAKPIHNANSNGSSTSASRAPARFRRHRSHPATSSATQTSRNRASSGTVVYAGVLEGPPAVGRESHEGPDVSAVGEVPDAVDAGQAKPEAEHPAEQSRHPRHGWPRRPRHWVGSANACSGHLLLRLGQVLPPVSRPQSVARWTPLCHFLLLEKRAALPRPRFARPLLR